MLPEYRDGLATLLASHEAVHPLERIARLARGLAHTQIGYVALVDEQQIWFVGGGADAPKTAPRGDTIVDMALRKKDLVWSQEAVRDEKLAHDPFVAGRRDARFYAAAPVVLPSGARVGAIAVLDRRVRGYDGDLAEQLKDLAAMAAETWEPWRNEIRAEPALEEPLPDFADRAKLKIATASVGSAATPAAGLGDALRARVLLAEDNAINRKVVELILQSVGVDLVCVENGAEALAVSAAEPFDLILMDMQMPVMDGLTATRAIREREKATGAAPMPILCLTANALPEHIAASREAGADSHLTKPISAAGLIAAVRQTVERGAVPAPARRSA